MLGCNERKFKNEKNPFKINYFTNDKKLKNKNKKSKKKLTKKSRKQNRR